MIELDLSLAIDTHDDQSQWTEVYNLIFPDTQEYTRLYMSKDWLELRQIIIKKLKSLSELELELYDLSITTHKEIK